MFSVRNWIQKNNTLLCWIIAILLLAIFFIRAAAGIREKTATYDEPEHILRGYAYLRAPDLRLNTHHPPLINIFTALPLFSDTRMRMDFSEKNSSWETADMNTLAERLGQILLFSPDMLLSARLMNILLGVILGLLLFAFAKKYFGAFPALLALIFYTLCPNILAHTSLVTTDIGITLFMFLALWAYLAYVQNPTLKNLFALSFALLSAFLTKFNSIMLIPFFIIFSFFYFWSSGRKIFEKKFILRLLKHHAILLLILLGGLAAFYKFEIKTLAESYHSEQLYGEFSNLITIKFPQLKIQNSILWISKNIPLPFPYYIQGFIENIYKHSFWGHNAFLAGKYSKRGWWEYFPTAFAIKTPVPQLLGTLLALVLGAIYIISQLKKKSIYPPLQKIKILIRENSAVCMLFFFAAFYTAIALRAKLNLGLRYILPVYPAVFIFMGIALSSIFKKNKKNWGAVLGILLLWQLQSSVFIHPDYLAYFNEFIGGPKNGYKYLLDSNLSWGQNDLLVEQYIQKLKKENPSRPAYLDPGCEPKRGAIIVDVNKFQGVDDMHDRRYAWLRENFSPEDMIHYTHLVFFIDTIEGLDKKYFELCKNLTL